MSSSTESVAAAVATCRPEIDLAATEPRRCSWCGASLVDARQVYCSKKHRQTAFRLRRRRGVSSLGSAGPGRFAYADPPYPSLSLKYYGREPTFAGEVDHPALIASLGAAKYDGWALSTSERALRWLLPLCPEGAHVCPWVKPHGVRRDTLGIHNAWEVLIVVGGRQHPRGVRDFLYAQAARGGGSKLMGRKPLAFCAWLFDLLGMLPGDELIDLFPGSGVVARSWSELSRRGAPANGDVLWGSRRANLVNDPRPVRPVAEVRGDA